jgi:hypothetical protein
MDVTNKPRVEQTPSPDGRVPRPVTARPPKNPRQKDIVADAKKRFAAALAYLAAH